MQGNASQQPPEKPLAVGIDFGTAQSSVGVYYGGKVVIVENDWANSATPSCVAFTDTECLVGEDARSQITGNPANTVMASKRLLGRSGADPTIPALTRYWPVEVVGGGPRPNLRVEYKEERRSLIPEELCSAVVTRMKKTVEAFTGKQVTDVVVTVPTCSNHLQEKALVDACTFAGLNVFRVLDDTSAGALAYIHTTYNRDDTSCKCAVVLDIGAGHVSASVVLLETGVVEVKSKCGSSLIGGEDFTGRLVDHVVREFSTRYRKDATSNRKAISRIHRACELAKRELSSLTESTIELEAPMDSLDYYHTIIRRDTFERLNHDLFERVIELVRQAIEDSRVNVTEKIDIHEMVLVGGSTKIPKIQSLLHEAFPQFHLIKHSSLNPTEAGAYGATLHAAVLQGCEQDHLLLDCMPSTIGIEVAGGEMCMLVRKNWLFPRKDSFGFTTQYDNQSVVLFKVFKGEHLLTKDNVFLGHFALTGIPPAPLAVPKIKVTVNVTVQKRISIHFQAVELRTGKQAELTVSCDPLPLERLDGFRDIVPVLDVS